MKSLFVAVCGVFAIGSVILYAGQKGSTASPATSVNAIPIGPALPFAKSALEGNYYFGDGLGVNCHLELKESGRFTFQWRGCLGVYDENEGAWEVRGDTLFLHPEKENEHEGFEGLNIRFVPVVWNQRIYLIDEFEAPGFFSDMPKTKSAESNGRLRGQHYVKRNDSFEAERVQLTDYFPKRFEDFIGKPPTECTVIALSKDGTVLVDKGSRTGLRPGLMLAADEWYTGDLEILSVTADRATARPGYFFNSEHLVEVGDKFDTGGRWMGPRGTGDTRLEKPRQIKPRPNKDKHGG